MQYNVPPTITISIWVFLMCNALQASVALVERQPATISFNEELQQNESLKEHFFELISRQKYDQFMAEVLLTAAGKYYIIVDVVRKAGNIPLVKAFLEETVKADKYSWTLQFIRASERCDLVFAQALWDIRHLGYKPEDDMWKTIHEAIKRDDIQWIRWGVEALKSSDQLDVLSKKKNGTCIVPTYSRVLGRMDTDPVTSDSLLDAADLLNRRDIMILLLQNGADHTQNGEYPSNGTLRTHYSRVRKNSFRSMMKPFFLLRPRIIDLVLQSCHEPSWMGEPKEKKPTMQYHNHCMAAKAFIESPGLASEYINDSQNGNNPLHCAVLAKNPKLIWICLRANSKLLESKNRFGETPITLAYAKDLRISLLAIIGACREIMQPHPNNPL